MEIFPSEEHKAALMGRLKTLGVEQVEVDFSGGGDSGAIDAVTASRKPPGHERSDRIDITNESLEWVEEASTFTDGKWEVVLVHKMLTLDEILRQVTYNALQTTNLDWYNNDGGSGQLTLDLTGETPQIDLDVYINYTETDDYSFTF